MYHVITSWIVLSVFLVNLKLCAREKYLLFISFVSMKILQKFYSIFFWDVQFRI